MAEAVYVLCSVTSLTCAALLLKAYQSQRTPLLFWAVLCFVALAGNNVVLVVDLIFLPKTIDLSVWRTLLSALGLSLFLGGLIWEKV